MTPIFSNLKEMVTSYVKKCWITLPWVAIMILHYIKNTHFSPTKESSLHETQRVKLWNIFLPLRSHSYCDFAETFRIVFLNWNHAHSPETLIQRKKGRAARFLQLKRFCLCASLFAHTARIVSSYMCAQRATFVSSTLTTVFLAGRPFYLALNENDIITRWNSLSLHNETPAQQWRVCSVCVVFFRPCCVPETLQLTANFFSSHTNCEITFIACVKMKCTRARCAALSFSFFPRRRGISTSKHICQLLFDLFLTPRALQISLGPRAALCAENLAAADKPECSSLFVSGQISLCENFSLRFMLFIVYFLKHVRRRLSDVAYCKLCLFFLQREMKDC